MECSGLILRDSRQRVLLTSVQKLSDERLSKALMAMHQHPERPWDLGRLADVAGMSRARFAAHFREVVGATPMAYLTAWRMAIVQTMLRRGEPLKSDCAGSRLRELDGIKSHFYAVDGAVAHRVDRPQPVQRLSSLATPRAPR
jgi:AraC-like DNA-binding protein